MGHLLFFIQNAHSREGRKLPKCYVKKFTNFSSIACINEESFSISFGSKISSDYGDSSCQSFNFLFFLTKTDFFVLSTLKLVPQEPIKLLEPKLNEKLLTLSHAFERK